MVMFQPSMSGTSSGQDLASLFTDLDPLGTGKSKPFVDKKDFFSDSKTSPKMGVPELNVGSEMTANNMSESAYNTSILSSSPCQSYMSTSRYGEPPTSRYVEQTLASRYLE